jgi:competence protein ComEA
MLYAGLGVALLLVGARWIRSHDSGATGGVSYASGPGAAGGGGSSGGFHVSGEGGDVVVHVAGAVRHPGVYRLPAGSRVTDAVDRAGGPDPGAAVDGVNLAARLSDGQQVVVPGKVAAGAAASSAAAPDNGPISLGTATAEQLDTIEGIGPVTAQKIIEYRDQHGGLSSVEELNRVSGIGPATMSALRARLQP